MRYELRMKIFKTRVIKVFDRQYRLRFLKSFSSLDAMRHHKEKLLNEISNLHYEREILRRENIQMSKEKKELEGSLEGLKAERSSINIKSRLAEKTSFQAKNHKHKVNMKTLVIQLLILIVIIFSVFYHDDFFKFYREDRQKINESTLDTSMYEIYEYDRF